MTDEVVTGPSPEEREREYKRYRDNERTMMIAAMVASGLAPRHEHPGKSAPQIARDSIAVAQEIMKQVEALP